MVVPDSLSLPLGTVQDALINCPSTLTQHAALFALDHPELVEPFRKTIFDNFKFTIEKLKPLAEKNIISFAQAEGGFYLFVNVHGQRADDLCKDLIDVAKVAVVPGHTFGPSGVQYFRLCYAREKDVLAAGLNRIVDYFESSHYQPKINHFAYAAR